jgi:hypothetical protein
MFGEFFQMFGNFFLNLHQNDKKNSKKFDLHCEIQPEKKAVFG